MVTAIMIGLFLFTNSLSSASAVEKESEVCKYVINDLYQTREEIKFLNQKIDSLTSDESVKYEILRSLKTEYARMTIRKLILLRC